MTRLSDEHYEKLDRKRGPSGLFRNNAPYEPIQFDIDLLRLLPDEGATKGRYMPDHLNVTQIKRLLDPALTSGFVGMRLRKMKDEGLVIRAGGNKQAGGWQRTEKGKELAVKGTVSES